MPPPSRRKDELAVRRRLVAELYLAGRSQREIAERFGVNDSQITRDLKYIREEWRRQTARDRAAWVAEQLAAYEWIWRHLAPALVSGESSANEKARVASVMLDVLRQRSDLLGLDEPTRIQILATEELDAEAERLAAELAALERDVGELPAVAGV